MSTPRRSGERHDALHDTDHAAISGDYANHAANQECEHHDCHMIGIDRGIKDINGDGLEEADERTIASQAVDRPCTNEKANEQRRYYRAQQESQQDRDQWGQHRYGRRDCGDFLLQNGLSILLHLERHRAGFRYRHVRRGKAGAGSRGDDFAVQSQFGRVFRIESVDHDVETDVGQKHLRCVESDIGRESSRCE